MRSTNSTRRGMWCSFTTPSSSRTCDATTSATCVLTSSTSETLSSDEFKAARTCTSYLHLARGRSSSTKCFDMGLTSSNTRMGGSSPMHQTLSTCARLSLSNCTNLVHQ
jgi:hypothetical protein